MRSSPTGVMTGHALALGVLSAVGLTSVSRADEPLPLSVALLSEQSLMLTEPEPSRTGEAAFPESRQPTAASDAAVETGTDPSKLLLRFEINPQYIEQPGGSHIFSTNLKLDVPLTKSFAVAVEIPVIHAGGFPEPLDEEFGLGDIFLRARNVWSFERSSLIAGAELGLKTADDELLGSGKWQINPSLAYVYYLTSEYLVAISGKQRLSVAGDEDRADINQSELRLIGIAINPRGRWLLADYQPKIDWEQDGEVSHLLEFEAGMMLTLSVGVSVRPGVGIGAHRDREWSIGVGLRVFF